MRGLIIIIKKFDEIYAICHRENTENFDIIYIKILPNLLSKILYIYINSLSTTLINLYLQMTTY